MEPPWMHAHRCSALPCPALPCLQVTLPANETGYRSATSLYAVPFGDRPIGDEALLSYEMYFEPDFLFGEGVGEPALLCCATLC